MHISLLSLRMKSYPVLPARSSQAFFLLLPWVPLIFYSYFCPYLNLCVCVFKYSFIRLHQVSSCGTQDLLCSMRDLVPQSGKEPRLPHWEFRDPVTDPAGKSLMCVFIFSSVRVRLCDSMNRSMPGLPVHHQLPEFFSNKVWKQATYIKWQIVCFFFYLGFC